MPQRTIPSRQYNAGQIIERTFNDLERFGRCGIDFSVAGWPAGVVCLTLEIALSDGRKVSTTFDGTPPKDGSGRKGIELTVDNPDAFDSVTVTGTFSQTVTTDFRIWGERTLGVASLGKK